MTCTYLEALEEYLLSAGAEVTYRVMGRGRLLSSRLLAGVGLNKNLSWNAQMITDSPNHLQRERNMALEDGARLASQTRLEILFRQAAAFHVIKDGLDGIWQRQSKVRVFVGLDQENKELQLITLRSARLGIEDLFDPAQCFLMFVAGSDRADVHGSVSFHTVLVDSEDQIVATSILS